jgi:hypothetical protein
MADDIAIDKESGISIRYIKEWDITKSVRYPIVFRD